MAYLKPLLLQNDPVDEHGFGIKCRLLNTVDSQT